MGKKQSFREKSRVIKQNIDYLTYSYLCEGKGEYTVYTIFDGIEIIFMDFETPDRLIPDHSPNEEIIEISWCRKGRVECEFVNQTISYLQEGDFGINGNACMPISYTFPLEIYEAVTLVVNRSKCSEKVKSIMQLFSIDIDLLFEKFNLKKEWYISREDKRLKHLFDEIYEAKGKENNKYFAIKSLELLYHVSSLSEINTREITYYRKEQIRKVKKIRDLLITLLDQKISVEQCALDEGIGVTSFRSIFSQIYGDTPINYLTKYKMAVATKLLGDTSLSITSIALKLGYSNPSKFSAAFKKEYGILPKDYRKGFEDSGYFE